MFAIGLTHEAAENLLARLTAHVPPDVPIGRPRAVLPDAVLAGPGAQPELFELEANGAVSRLLPLGSGLSEVTTWRLGREISRYVINEG